MRAMRAYSQRGLPRKDCGRQGTEVREGPARGTGPQRLWWRGMRVYAGGRGGLPPATHHVHQTLDGSGTGFCSILPNRLPATRLMVHISPMIAAGMAKQAGTHRVSACFIPVAHAGDAALCQIEDQDIRGVHTGEREGRLFAHGGSVPLSKRLTVQGDGAARDLHPGMAPILQRL